MADTLFEFADDPADIYRQFADRFDAIKSERESSVTAWRWATGEMINPRPFSLLISRGKKSKWLPSRTSPDDYEYGMSGGGEAVVLRLYGQSNLVDGEELLRAEKFTFVMSGRIVSLHFVHDVHYGVELTAVAVTRLSEAGPVSHAQYSQMHSYLPGNRVDEAYHYDGIVLTHADIIRTNQLGSRNSRIQYEYSDDGTLLRVVGRGDTGESHLVYQKPAKNRLNKTATRKKAAEELAEAAGQCFLAFRRDYPDDDLYAFAFVMPCEGTYVYCAFATEEGLDVIAEYYNRRYPAGDADLDLWRQEMRWAGVEDGWRRYLLDGSRIPDPPMDRDALTSLGDGDCPFKRTLDAAFAESVFALYDESTGKICADALQRMDSAGLFGEGAARERIAIGCTTAEDIEDFARMARKVNPASVVSRLRDEMKRAEAVSAARYASRTN